MKEINYILDTLRRIRNQKKVGLVDILAAMHRNKPNSVLIDTKGYFWVGNYTTGIEWNLQKDDIMYQSRETVHFIYTHLG